MRQVVESLRAARRALRYVGPAYRRAQRVDLLKQRLRWPVLAALEPRATLHWFERCARAPLAAAVRLQPLLPLKPLRPYLSMRWNRRQRMRVIEHSWKLLLGGPAALREAVATPGGRRLAQVTVGGEALELRLVPTAASARRARSLCRCVQVRRGRRSARWRCRSKAPPTAGGLMWDVCRARAAPAKCTAD